MKIELATVVPGTETPAGDGQSGAVRCVLALMDGTRRAAILKRLDQPAVLAEAFSALLLSGWGLTVPQPFLVDEDDGKFAFASADATYPSLKQRLSIGDVPDGPLRDALVQAACHLVAGFPETPLAIVADEAIDNRDRNLGNILWDGSQEAWIDHELAVGLAQHLDDVNKLAAMVCATPSAEAVKGSVIPKWMALDRTLVGMAAASLEAHEIGQLVADRLNGLGNRLLNRFPSVNDLLSE